MRWDSTVTDVKDAREESNRRAFVLSRISTGIKHTTVELKRCQNTSYNVIYETSEKHMNYISSQTLLCLLSDTDTSCGNFHWRKHTSGKSTAVTGYKHVHHQPNLTKVVFKLNIWALIFLLCSFFFSFFLTYKIIWSF